jgi:hypothetical protein
MMTEKAKKILQKIQLRKLFRNPKMRDRILDEFNSDNSPDVKPLRGDQGLAVLKDMNDLESGHEEFAKSLASWGDVQQQSADSISVPTVRSTELIQTVVNHLVLLGRPRIQCSLYLQ